MGVGVSLLWEPIPGAAAVEGCVAGRRVYNHMTSHCSGWTHRGLVAREPTSLSCLASRPAWQGPRPHSAGLLVFTAGAQAGVDKIDWSPGPRDAWEGVPVRPQGCMWVENRGMQCLQSTAPGVRLGERFGEGVQDLVPLSGRGAERPDLPAWGDSRGAGERWSRGHGPVLQDPRGGCLQEPPLWAGTQVP